MNHPIFQILKSSATAQFYFRLQAHNGETLLKGDKCTTKQSCEEGIAFVKNNAPFDVRYERYSICHNYHFTITRRNGEVVGTSENYASITARETGITAVKQDAPVAAVEDLS